MITPSPPKFNTLLPNVLDFLGEKNASPFISDDYRDNKSLSPGLPIAYYRERRAQERARIARNALSRRIGRTPLPRVLLITNDDGIDAPGIAALERALAGLGERRVVAPLHPQSGCGHFVTTHESISLEHRDESRIAVAGSPADCVRLALHHLIPEADWVISGINAGGNLGTDVHHSGTVAAVREGAIRGKSGIAISHYIAKGRGIDWDFAAARAARVIAELIERPLDPGSFWNVNLPHPDPGAPEPAIVYCEVDPSPLPLAYELDPETGKARYRGVYQERARRPGGDVDLCFGGKIAVSLIRS